MNSIYPKNSEEMKRMEGMIRFVSLNRIGETIDVIGTDPGNLPQSALGIQQLGDMLGNRLNLGSCFSAYVDGNGRYWCIQPEGDGLCAVEVAKL